jgi:hypothetical protein
MFSQKPSLELKAHPDFSAFQFTSRGIAGSTIRQVRFISQKEGNVYNLDISDLHPKDQSAQTITDNGDMNNVLTTLILIIELYTERYPTRVIRLKGNTKEKARLYRIALDMHVDILYPHFDIGLELEDRFFPLRGSARECIDNIAFILKRRPGLCVSVHSIQTTRSSRSLLFGKTVSVETRRNVEVGVVDVGAAN